MLKFIDILDNDIPEDECKYCLPECTTTVYDTSISYAEFQECDHTNTGTNMLCDMVNGTLNPAPWTHLAQTEYTNVSPNDSLPWYLETDGEKFNIIFKKDNLKIIPGDYTVTITNGISHFKYSDTKYTLDYWIALESDSTYKATNGDKPTS